MGFTHYFSFAVPKGIKANELESAYQRAVLDCSRIARTYNKECLDSGDNEARLSGYTAHVKPGTYGGIKLNGKGDNACEEFTLREHFKQNIDDSNGFVKTNRKPYDIVIVACLAVLKHRLGNAVHVASDGDPSDWNEGVALARRITKLAVKNPIQSEYVKPATLRLVRG